MHLISVCICTYQRFELLEKLLHSLQCLRSSQDFNYEIIVVDNDADKTAQSLVLNFSKDNKGRRIIYDVEPEQNIALARNKCLSHARGDYVAFIDDDEYPSLEWLLNLYLVITEVNADAVLGPVLPEYPVNTPHWIIKGRFFDRPNPPDKSRVYEGRTGNALVKRGWFDQFQFDPVYGLIGGSDSAFFKKVLNAGGAIYWSKKAYVTEYVQESRLNLKWLLARAFRGGQGAASVKYSKKLCIRIIPHLIYRFALCIVATSAAILVFPFGCHKSAWWLRKAFSNAGQFSVIFPYRYKEYSSKINL